MSEVEKLIVNPEMLRDGLYYCCDWNKEHKEQGDYVLRGLMCSLMAVGAQYGEAVMILCRQIVKMREAFNMDCVPAPWTYDFMRGVEKTKNASLQ